MLRSNQSGLYTDLWALGCIIYELEADLKMFHGKNNKTIFDRITDMDYQFPLEFDPFAKDLVQSLVNPNPRERIGLKNISAIK